MADPTVTKNEDGSTTHSYKLSEMSSDQLVLLLQALGRKKDEIRQDMIKLQALLRERLKKEQVAHLQKQMDEIQKGINGETRIDGEAPGAVIEASISKAD